LFEPGADQSLGYPEESESFPKNVIGYAPAMGTLGKIFGIFRYEIDQKL
jgi:hypothetical protein